MDKLVSIIVRTKNEEEWIADCLDAIYKQTYKNLEVILVDTGSTDDTLEKVAVFPQVKVVHYTDPYLPGKALNFGCKEATGDYLVFISAHCVPVDDQWLISLIEPLLAPEVAAVYGRQEPTADSDPFDKRDLILTFGLDRKVQWTEPFFHNANSAMKKELWDKIPFDDTVTNIEDRVWAANMQSLGYCITYEPSASVFHHHGIHQTGCKIRCEGVNNVMRNIHNYIVEPDEYKKEYKKAVAVIPFSEDITNQLSLSNVFKLYDSHASELLNCNNLDKVYLLTDSKELMDYSFANYKEIVIPYLREKKNDLSLLGVLEEFITKVDLEDDDIVLLSELIYCAKNKAKYFDDLIENMKAENASSAAWIEENKNPLYKSYDERMIRMDEEVYRYKGKHSKCYEVKNAFGLANIVSVLRKGHLLDVNPLLLKDEKKARVIKIFEDIQIEEFLSISKFFV